MGYYNDDECAFKEITENPIILDFTNCKYIGTIYKRIKRGLNLPYDYGENYDALWDAMRSYWKKDTHIILIGVQTLTEDMQDYMQGIITVFQRVHDETPNVTFEIIS